MKDEIIELEEKLRLVMLTSDVSVLDELLSKDLLFTNHLGMLISKEDDLRSHSNSEFVFKSLILSDIKYIIEENSAVVSSKSEICGTYNGQPANGSFRFTRFWHKNTGKWQVVAGHSSVIA